ncbi:uncharacterized protein LOC134201765 [Bombyx mori]|uniref:uncharacterized protein LOC134201765 n=1 Tax=Bombyx mori TaxID=7091 RepID=UPI002ED5A394
MASGTVDEAVDVFYSILYRIIDQFIPVVDTSINDAYPVWYDRALINLLREKQKAHRRWKRYKNPLDYDTFSMLRGRMNVMQNACYLKYLAHCQKTIKCNPKMLWSYVNSKRKCNTGYPGIMTLDDKQLTGSDDICAAFNCYFKSMFAQPTCSSSVAGQAYTGVDSNSFAGTFSVTQKTVFKMLSKLDTKKGAGGDLIPPFFVLKCAGPLSVPLCIIFNRSVSEGIFPAKWKEASIVPLHKKGTKCKMENYRPISILNVFAKCLERVVYDEVYPMIIKGIPEEQHGFVKGRSTTSNLSLFVSDVHRGMGFQSQVDVMYTDFERAFDRVDHIILLQKLQQLGITGIYTGG